jgi:hypothetical protein
MHHSVVFCRKVRDPNQLAPTRVVEQTEILNRDPPAEDGTKEAVD